MFLLAVASLHLCAIKCICVSVYQKIQYISHSQESLKASTYLVKE